MVKLPNQRSPKRLSAAYQRLSIRYPWLQSSHTRVLPIIAFALIGTLLLLRSYGAAMTANIQAENGTVSGATKKTDDTSASGGGYVQFGSPLITQRLEAEQANHNVAVETAGKEYASGGAVLGFFGTQGKFVEFTVHMSTAGSYGVYLRYAAADGTATQLNPLPRTLIVNGSNLGNINFPRTSSTANNWNSLATQSLGNLNLNAGNNTIRLQIDTSSEGYWDVDYLEVAGTGPVTPPPPPPPPPPPGPPVTNPVPETIVANAKYVSANGNDSNPGTFTLPYQSIHRAFDTMTAGQGGTIYVREGTYEMCGSYPQAGNESSYTRVVNYPNNTSQARLTCSTGNAGALFYQNARGGNYLEIKNLHLNCATIATSVFSNNSIFEPNNGAHHLKMIGNLITGCGQSGVGLFNTDNVLIEANTITGNAHDGFFSGVSVFEMVNKPGNPIDPRGYRIVIKNNRIFGNKRTGGAVTDGNCIIFDHNNTYDYTGRALVENNLCYDNYGPGFRSVDSSNIDVFNNTFYQNTLSVTQSENPWSPIPNAPYAEIDLDHHINNYPPEDRPSNVLFKNNIIYPRPGRAPFCLILMKAPEMIELNNRFQNNIVMGQGAGDEDCPAITGNGNIVNADPRFVNPNFSSTADFRLQSGSPAINAGATGGPSVDFLYLNRDSQPDIGALEFR